MVYVKTIGRKIDLMADCLFELTSYFFYIILDNFIGIKNLLLLEFSKKKSCDEKNFRWPICTFSDITEDSIDLIIKY